MQKLFTLFIIIGLFQSGYAQKSSKNKIVDIVIHKVELGETIVMISRKYLVEPKSIYGANRFIIDGVNEGMVLQIPVPRKEGQEYATMQYIDPVIDEDVIPAAILAVTNPIATNKNPIADNTEAVATEEEEVTDNKNPVAVNNPTEPIQETSVLAKNDPIAIKEDPVIIKNDPIATKEEPVIIKNEPIAIKEEPVTVIDKPIVTTDNPIAATEPEKDPVFETKRLTITKIERDDDTQYKIKPKETLFEIAKRYEITMEEIMERNADVLKNGLVVGQVIFIPATKKIIGWDQIQKNNDTNLAQTDPVPAGATAVAESQKPVVSASNKTANGFTYHKVKPKETLYNLAKQYLTTIEEILLNNESVKKNGLTVGANLKIPISKTGKIAETGIVAELDKKIQDFTAPQRKLEDTDIIHKVGAGETLNSLSIKYNVAVYDIRSNNQNIMAKGLQVGQSIRIPKPKTTLVTKDEIAAKVDAIATTQARSNENQVTNKPVEEENYIVGDIITTVQANETIEDIAKKYEVTPEEIIRNNVLTIKNGKVQKGQVIKVPATKGGIEFSPETFD